MDLNAGYTLVLNLKALLYPVFQYTCLFIIIIKTTQTKAHFSCLNIIEEEQRALLLFVVSYSCFVNRIGFTGFF